MTHMRRNRSLDQSQIGSSEKFDDDGRAPSWTLRGHNRLSADLYDDGRAPSWALHDLGQEGGAPGHTL